ncbi:hypothetical protein JW964_18670 [candidate division KSB1 bacterium]|nr:hypothetical protein [candidate division KSB1 bacterium]
MSRKTDVLGNGAKSSILEPEKLSLYAKTPNPEPEEASSHAKTPDPEPEKVSSPGEDPKSGTGGSLFTCEDP